jgi:superfamily II DNA/RNA helicase
VIEVLASETQVKVILGEKGLTDQGQILVTVPGYLKNRLAARQCNLDLSELKMIVYDEADELFVQ